jgi:hypothetical protein
MNFDEFRNLFKNTGFAEREIKIGVVLKYWATETNPPKPKIRIVVGFSNDKVLVATLFINTEINPNIFPTEELRKLHLAFEKTRCEYLDHDSFVDCSQLHEVSYDNLVAILNENPTVVSGEVANADLEKIKNIIKNAVTITPKQKKRFGFL